MDARPPFKIVRTHQSGAFTLACLDLEGVILANGQWKRIRAGQACLLPPFVLNALKCLLGKPWRFTWVRYREVCETGPIVSAISLVKEASIMQRSMYAESLSGNGASALYHGKEQLHYDVLQFA